MNEDKFKQLFQKIVELYQIPSDTADELLKRILSILAEHRKSNKTE